MVIFRGWPNAASKASPADTGWPPRCQGSKCRRGHMPAVEGGMLMLIQVRGSFWGCHLVVLLGCLEGKSWQLCGGLW